MSVDSILNGNERLTKRIAEIAEVAGYLWQKGWAERNGGNITLNITDMIEDSFADQSPVNAKYPIGKNLSYLKGCYFYCKGTNKRMRDLAKYPMENGSVIRIDEDGSGYDIIADFPILPTSELPAHLSIHNYLLEIGSDYRVVLHTHPTELIALTHNFSFLGKNVLSRLLWGMIPEARLFCPKGIGIAPYQKPGSVELANETLEQLKSHDIVLWEKHGICAVGKTILEVFDEVDTLSKSAQIYLCARSMGFDPEGMSDSQISDLSGF